MSQMTTEQTLYNGNKRRIEVTGNKAPISEE